MAPTTIVNLSIVLPYAPAVIGIVGVIRKRYPRINGPLYVLALLIVTSAALLFALDAVPSDGSTREAAVRFARCTVLLAFEAFGITYGLDRLGARATASMMKP